MPLLNSFINETLRKCTPAPLLIARRVLEDHMIVDVKVKKGWNVTYYFMAAQQDG
jgi:cytochrome P450